MVVLITAKNIFQRNIGLKQNYILLCINKYQF
ncbi:hypothetical protein AU14_15550 [Marinobacter similis]|uniref:Uncharacterized protein n=1 Tax=Marinobacter similis TaxID=1420916 RepID=W5YLW5_9GAMM|nr:hypothetical protein AU14_15550 [Marinobacter similis]